MPRRRVITVDCLNFQWGPDGAAVSARLTNRPRPLAYEFGRVLLALEGIQRRRDTARDTHARPDPIPPSATEVAALAEVSERDARATLRNLLPSGCVVQEQVRVGRHYESARWAHGFRLGPERDIRGPDRRPRLNQLALLIEPSIPCGDLMDVVLRECGVLAVQVTDSDEAVRLLRVMGFELVIADQDTTAALGWEALAHACHLAACGPLAALVAEGHRIDERSLRARRIRATLAKPFTPAAFGILVNQLIGTDGIPLSFLRGVGA